MYALGHIPVSIAFFVETNNYYSSSVFYDIALLFRIFTTHVINPLIYGLLDKKIVMFWRNWRKKETNVMMDATKAKNAALLNERLQLTRHTLIKSN